MIHVKNLGLRDSLALFLFPLAIYFRGIYAASLALFVGVFVGYFLGDIQVSFAHFLIDNYRTSDPGYKHHVVVAISGFDQDNISPQQDTTVCAPGCHPCIPCEPCEPCTPAVKQYIFDTITNLLPLHRLLQSIEYASFIELSAEVLLLYSGFVGSILVFVYHTSYIINIIAGSGAPDYYAHHPDEAPLWLSILQRARLVMNTADHEYHHANPDKSYSYFSSITNIILDELCFWPLARYIVFNIYGVNATLPAKMALVGSD